MPARLALLLVNVTLWLVAILSSSASGQWKMHIIDDSSKGADGVRLADFNGDKLMDIVTGWEEGGLIRVYQNPGPQESTQKWPAVTVGKVNSPEDAIFVDLDGDGNLDVVSCCEGRTQSVYVHWAPKQPDHYLDSSRWITEPFPIVKKKSMWMFAVSADIDKKHGVDLFLGSKGKNGCVGWLQSPANPRRLQDWKFHRICDAGWVMSLRKASLNGSLNLLVSDRKGPSRGVYFLKPGATVVDEWNRTAINRDQFEFMFLDYRIRKKLIEVDVATRNGKILRYSGVDDSSFQLNLVSNPAGIRNGKAVAAGDIDMDGDLDLVHSTNTQSISKRKKIAGIHWLKNKNGKFESFPVSGTIGMKYDRIELIDLDGDQDLDILTCEEAANLGVIWFENPARDE